MNRILLTLAVVVLSAANVWAQESGAMPTLRGQEAIEQLKESGRYDSLMEALKGARQKDGQTPDENTSDAVGQSAKLTASDGAEHSTLGQC